MKPRFVRQQDGAQTADDAYLEWNYLQNLITEHSNELVKDVPVNPYILLTKPTQKPEERTLNKKVPQQLAELKKINDERGRNRAEVFAQNMHEYVALQNVWPEELAEVARAENINLDNLSPLDRDTLTRYISMPLSSGGFVPVGRWDPGNRQFSFGRYDADFADPSRGFRLSVRVEI